MSFTKYYFNYGYNSTLEKNAKFSTAVKGTVQKILSPAEHKAKIAKKLKANTPAELMAETKKLSKDPKTPKKLTHGTPNHIVNQASKNITAAKNRVYHSELAKELAKGK